MIASALAQVTRWERSMPDLEPDSSATKHLLSQAASGDRGVFNYLFERHERLLRRFIKLHFDRRLRARLDPSDVLQETQLHAFRNLDDYLRRRPMPFHLWLQKTAYDRLRTARRRHLRAARRSVERERPLADRSSRILAQQILAEISPSQRLSHAEVIRIVGEAIAELGETDREILMMRSFEGLSFDEIACLLEIEAAAARKRYGRALLRLRQMLVGRGLFEDES
jgi:RNA polymerase sigma-70 factor, ECF subfamily